MDFTTALGHMLSNPELRQAYRRDRQRLVGRLAIEPADWEEFLRLDVSGLEAQAEVLLDKRFHEVSRLLPQTVAQLGTQAPLLFRAYAAGHWPRGHRRHGEDAVAFGPRLQECGEQGFCRAEWNRLRFRLSSRRLALHVVPDLMIDGRPRWGLQVLYRCRDGARGQWCWYVLI